MGQIEILTWPEPVDGGVMEFTHYNLGHVVSGSIVEIILQGRAANVRLMNSSDFNSYKAGLRHCYHSGLARPRTYTGGIAGMGLA